MSRYSYRVIPVWNNTTTEEFGHFIDAIEAAGYRYEYVHGESGGIHCIRYWNETGTTHRVI